MFDRASFETRPMGAPQDEENYVWQNQFTSLRSAGTARLTIRDAACGRLLTVRGRTLPPRRLLFPDMLHECRNAGLAHHRVLLAVAARGGDAADDLSVDADREAADEDGEAA